MYGQQVFNIDGQFLCDAFEMIEKNIQVELYLRKKNKVTAIKIFLPGKIHIQ